MKRDNKQIRNWRQLEILFPVPIAPPTFASPKAAYDFFTQHKDEFDDLDLSVPESSDLDGAVAEFGHDSLDALSSVMSLSEFTPQPAPEPALGPIPESTPEPTPESTPEP